MPTINLRERNMRSLSRRSLMSATAVGLLLTLSSGAVLAANLPAGYPADYSKIIDAAVKEGKVSIYSTTDSAIVSSLLKDFEAAFPGIKVDYSDLNSTELYNRFIAEVASGQGTADLTWSSAPDLQIKLASGGYAMAYTSPEASHLPAWANYKNTVYGTTAEPVTIIYNKRLLEPGDVPTSHEDLLKLMTTKGAALKDKVAAYDPERSGVGFYFFNQDELNWKSAWDLNRAFGKASLKLYTSAGAMVEKVRSGEHVMAYGIFGSYALATQAKDENLGIVMPRDYTLITTRAAFVPEKAKNPNAGKVFLDYLLSARAQKIIAGDAKLFGVRDDVKDGLTLQTVKEMFGATVKPIALDDSLLDGLDQTKRLKFLKQWQNAMKGQ